MKSIVLAIAMMTTPVAGITAEPAAREVVPASENAAFQYWHAWWSLAEYMKAARGATYTAEGLRVDQGDSVQVVSRMLETASIVIDPLILASEMEKCDFGSRPEQNFNGTVLFQDPHLAPSRSSANLLALDAGRLYVEGDSAKATTRLATIFRMAEHVGRDRTLISCLVGASILEIGATYAERFQHLMTDEDRASIAESLTRFPDEDPLRFAIAVLGDSRAAADGLSDQIATGEFDADRLSLSTNSLASTLEQQMGEALGNSRAARLTRARLVRDAARLAVIGQAMYEAWDDAKALEALGLAASSGEYGTFARMIVQPYEMIRTSDTEHQAQLDALRAWAGGEAETLELPED